MSSIVYRGQCFGAWPDDYGVMKLETVPRGFWSQALMPLAPKKAYADFVGRGESPASSERP